MLGDCGVQNNAIKEVASSKDCFSMIEVVRGAWLSIEGFKFTALLIYLSTGVISFGVIYSIFFFINRLLINPSVIMLIAIQIILILYFQAVLISGISRFSLARLRQKKLIWSKDFLAFIFRQEFSKYFLANLIQMMIICIPGIIFAVIFF